MKHQFDKVRTRLQDSIIGETNIGVIGVDSIHFLRFKVNTTCEIRGMIIRLYSDC